MIIYKKLYISLLIQLETRLASLSRLLARLLSVFIISKFDISQNTKFLIKMHTRQVNSGVLTKKTIVTPQFRSRLLYMPINYGSLHLVIEHQRHSVSNKTV